MFQGHTQYFCEVKGRAYKGGNIANAKPYIENDDVEGMRVWRNYNNNAKGYYVLIFECERGIEIMQPYYRISSNGKDYIIVLMDSMCFELFGKKLRSGRWTIDPEYILSYGKNINFEIKSFSKNDNYDSTFLMIFMVYLDYLQKMSNNYFTLFMNNINYWPWR